VLTHVEEMSAELMAQYLSELECRTGKGRLKWGRSSLKYNPKKRKTPVVRGNSLSRLL
jgi:hypothetical protein